MTKIITNYNIILNLFFLLFIVGKTSKNSILSRKYYIYYYIATLCFFLMDYLPASDFLNYISKYHGILFIIIFSMVAVLIGASIKSDTENRQSIIRISKYISVVLMLYIIVDKSIIQSLINSYIVYSILFSWILVIIIKNYHQIFWTKIYSILMVGLLILIIYSLLTIKISMLNMNLLLLNVLIFITFFDEMEFFKDKIISKSEHLITKQFNFMRYLAHDLKSPLSNIYAYATEIELKSNKNESNQETKLIKENVTVLNNLIDEFTNLEKIKNDILKKELIDIAFVIKKFLYSNKEFYGKSERVNIHFSDVKVLGDLFFIERLIKNLLENAVKYASSDRKLQIQTKLTERPSYFHWIISDNGLGIARTDLDKIFDPEFRATNSKDKQGSGLGLTMVKFIVERHQWKITAESELNLGTSFIIQIPKSDVIYAN